MHILFLWLEHKRNNQEEKQVLSYEEKNNYLIMNYIKI